MKFESLKQSLKEKILPVYLISGEDVFLRHKSVELIKNAVTGNMPDLNITTINRDRQVQLKDILDTASTYPIGDEKRLTIVYSSSLKLTKADILLLQEYMAKPLDYSVIVFCDDGASLKLLEEFLPKVDCNFLGTETLTKIVTGMAGKLGKKVSDEAVSLILEYTNNDMAKINTEIQKLFVEAKTDIGINEVKELITKTEEYEAFEFTEALLKKNREKALKIYEYLQNTKQTSGILTMIYNAFARCFFGNTFEGNDEELSKYLACKPYAIKKAKENGRFWTKKQMKNILSKISEAELNFKSGKISEENAIFSVVDFIVNS